jgi:hypothetical protein
MTYTLQVTDAQLAVLYNALAYFVEEHIDESPAAVSLYETVAELADEAEVDVA